MKKKEFIPGDTAFSRLYPYPNYLSKNSVRFVLLVIVFVFILLLIKDILF